MSYSGNYGRTQEERQAAELAEQKKERAQLIKKVGLGVIAATLAVGGLWSLVALDRVDEGNFGVGKRINGMYVDQFIKPGFSFNYLTSVYEVDGRNNIIPITDIRPKDKDGLLLQDLDLNIIYNVNPERAVSFLREFRDITKSEDGSYSLGRTMVSKFAQRVASETIRGFSSSEMLDSPANVEDNLRKKLQERLDKEYGAGLFEITGVNVANIQVSPVVEQRIAATAAQEASAAVARAQEESLAARASAEEKEAQSLANISRKTSVSVDQLLEARRINTIASLPADTVKATVDVSRKPPSPQ